MNINPIHSTIIFCRRLLSSYTNILRAAMVIMALLPSLYVFSLPADFYVQSSRLASGKWARIEVKESGMQLISNTQLRNLGFADPEKVNVYGYGGRMLSENLDNTMPDDLPMVASIRTSAGIIFFGHATVSWAPATSGTLKYSHTLNPYATKAYYFISDCDGERMTPATTEPSNPAVDEEITTFTERIVHEQDLLAPSVSGRLILGEDFRTQSTRTFAFNLPDNTGDVNIGVKFGAKVSNGSASLIMSANGSQLPSTNSDKISGVASSETFLVMTSTVKAIENPGEKLNLAIQFSNSGALFTAALDYINVEYPRQLKLNKGELYFYISPDASSSVRLEGCSANTVVWDITDPLHPLEIPGTLSGSSFGFTAPAGYREYVAFNPAEISRAVTPAGNVSNQDIHGMEAPDMVIIAPDAFRSAALRVANLHTATDGVKAIVLSPEQIYNEFSSGVVDVTAFRKMFKMWYDRGEGAEGLFPRYCLIMSRPSYDNKMVTPTVKKDGYPRIPIWQSPTGLSASTSFSTDDYIGMLEDNIGTFSIVSAKINVAVGRMPVKTLAEANTAVTKLENYLLNPTFGSWRNNIMVIADDQDNSKHLKQAEDVIARMQKSANGGDFIYEKLYLDSYPLIMSPTGASYPHARQRMLDKISEGLLYINYIGHANPKGWGHEKIFTWNDITGMTNRHLPFIYAATCEFLRWDDDVVSGAEEMWLNPDAGIIGMICPSRKVYISLNGTLNSNTSPFVFGLNGEGKPMSLGDAMVAGKNATSDDGNKLRYGFLGDPAMKLPAPSLKVAVDQIDGTALATAEEAPVLKARSKVKISGHVADNGGNVVSDFNGLADIVLYDAEKVIETYGNGAEGTVETYNDRKTRLFFGKTEVKDGLWETEIVIPSEIENNFSPALLSIYASDERGEEANGSSEGFYIYGYDEAAADDFDGPEISGFFLNSPSFVNGSFVSPSATVYASLSDMSGINVSDAGIGHDMVIMLDGKKRFDDVVLHYTPDTSFEKGTISYPIDNIEPGEHTLELTVWDNANNSSTATLDFSVKAGWIPTISELSTDVSPASTSVTFRVATDGLAGDMTCRMEVFDLSGKKVWSNDASKFSSASNFASITWNLHDYAGKRVPRGIYIYRATVVTSEGAEISKSNKLAVTAQ